MTIPASDLHALVNVFVANVERIVREDVNARIGAALTNLRGQVLGQPVKTTPAALAVRASAPVKSGRSPRLCPVPGCGKPAAGPKYQWRCRDHGVLKSKPAGSKKSAPAKVRPAVPGDASSCHFPGCLNKHSGPRYHLFCREHFAKLSAADLAKYKAQWRANHS